MIKTEPIYVETKINTNINDLWEATQDPEKHQQWDLRFTSINYLPKNQEDDPQQFLYRTRIGFGMEISGKGETVKTLNKSGERSSSLKFWSYHPLSIIEEGSGYWKYIPESDQVKFLTLYNYKTRFGFLGKLFDRFIFRPIMGWATALSFDGLRLWLEKDIHPKISFQKSIIHLIVVIILSFIWIFQGFFPKILFPDSGELEMLRGLGFLAGYEESVLIAIGIGEIAFGLLFLIFAKKAGIYIWNSILLIILTIGAAISQPVVFIEPFNPITLNIAMIALSIIGILALKDLPDASKCKRKPMINK